MNTLVPLGGQSAFFDAKRLLGATGYGSANGVEVFGLHAIGEDVEHGLSRLFAGATVIALALSKLLLNKRFTVKQNGTSRELWLSDARASLRLVHATRTHPACNCQALKRAPEI